MMNDVGGVCAKKGEGVFVRKRDAYKVAVLLLAREGIYSFRGPAQGY